MEPEVDISEVCVGKPRRLLKKKKKRREEGENSEETKDKRGRGERETKPVVCVVCNLFSLQYQFKREHARKCWGCGL